MAPPPLKAPFAGLEADVRAERGALLAGYEIGACIQRTAARAIHHATRLTDRLPVVIKTAAADYPTQQEAARLRREFHIIERLQDTSGVIRAHALESYGAGNVALVLEPFGISLTERLALAGRSQQLDQFFAVAIGVAEVLGRIHERGIVHKNVEPGSILVDEHWQVRLIDFSIASELALERQSDVVAKHLEGVLPYISPEQTGRMNRDLDYRSDFYSLGITLFELLTGELPFRSRSALELVHSHIGTLPRAPSEIDRSIPQAIAQIVLKLLAKNAEERYQSSYGLVTDLRRCQRELTQHGSVQVFPLGHRDVSRQFQVPQRLYGRESELATLRAMLESAAAGNVEFCMVCGSSGIGKSALVNEIGKLLPGGRGYLIQGKFDQFGRSTPYSAVAVALRSLVQQLLTEPQHQQQELREKLLAAVGANGRVLLDWLPELQSILGPLPEVPHLPRIEAQNRFQLALLGFVRVIAREQLLIVFLDDLQYADAATLNLIRWLAAARELAHLLLIGAYRSNEVSAGHPLQLLLSEIGQLRTVLELPLQSLDLGSVGQLVADTLHAERAACLPLAELLHAQAQGNPFYLNQVLRTFEQERAITFSPEAGCWRWDMQAVRRSDLSSGVVDLVVANMRKLPAATQTTLQLAACIGYSFDLRTLSIIRERSMNQTADELLPALQRHMVVPLHDDYALAGEAAAGADAVALNTSYRFHHDRVQQAAYALIDAERKRAVHLSVGRLIQQHAAAQERSARLIEIVGHLNEGRSLIESVDERRALAQLNLTAGKQAQASAAYESALTYLRIGQELLPADSWASDYALTMALGIEYQQCAYLTAHYAEAEDWIDATLAQARTPLEKAEILALRTRQYATMGKMTESIQAAIQGLALLGLRISHDPSDAALQRERAAVRHNLAGRRIQDLIDAPTLTDPAKQIAMRLLMEIFAAAFLSGSGKLFPYLVLKSVNLCLSAGNSPESAFTYAAYGMLLCGALDDPALGYQYGQLAVALSERSEDLALKSRVIYVYAMFIHHWSQHWSSMTPWFRHGIESGYQSGDLLYLAYNAQDCIIWDPKLDLQTAAQQHASYLSIVRDCKYQDSLDSGTLFLQMQRNFLGLTNDLCSLSDAEFDEQRCVAGMRERRFMTGIANYHIYKAEICFLHGEHAAALEHVRQQDALIASAMSLPQLVRFCIVAFLTLADCVPDMAADEQRVTRRRLRADCARMRRWANNCPANFLHLQLLMQAELARLDGRMSTAQRWYERAIEAAQASEFLRDEAVANERAARHLHSNGWHKAADGYLKAARLLYERWGARRKVQLLEQEFGSVLGSPNLPSSELDLRASHAVTIDRNRLDLTSVMKASRAISSELVLDQLWFTTMPIMLESAGGQRGCFVVQRQDQLCIEGLTEIGQPARTMPPQELQPAAATVPVSIVHHVLRTNAPLVLQDAARGGNFSRDSYFTARQPRSLICIPLRRQHRLEAVIYMENDLAAGVFTEDRIGVLKLLAAQVSVSIENAQLYQDQQQLIAAQRRFIPSQFLESLAHQDIAGVGLGEHVAKTMSVLFADLRGFTPLAERLDPRSVIELLNHYFAAMAEPIAQAGGFIDSYAGDEIKVLFDAAPDAALHAGVAMSRALEQFNQHQVVLGKPLLQMGMGSNTGPVVLGTVGGQERIQCSVIGDTVNLASRIEQLTKLYRVRFLISEHTVRGLKQPQAFALRLVDRVAVKGKRCAVGLYEVIDAESPHRQPIKLATGHLLQAAIACYFRRELPAALQLFEQVAALDPDDAVPALFIERCTRHLQSPTQSDWEDFERLTHK